MPVLLQSVLVQQAVSAMQVPLQSLVPVGHTQALLALQTLPVALLLQSALPQHAVAPTQVPLLAQYFWFRGHVPLQAAFWAMHTPLQFCGRLDGQFWTQAVPLQLTEPPVGSLQAVVHSVSPQVALALLSAQTPLQLWYPELQRTVQAPA
jgi:hypothetical protein